MNLGGDWSGSKKIVQIEPLPRPNPSVNEILQPLPSLIGLVLDYVTFHLTHLNQEDGSEVVGRRALVQTIV
jgi:hypothetical protein